MAPTSRRPSHNRTGKGTRKLRKLNVRKQSLKLVPPYISDRFDGQAKKGGKLAIKRILLWLFNSLLNPWKILLSTATVTSSPRSEFIDLERTKKELRETRRELENVKQRVRELQIKVEEIAKKSVAPTGLLVTCPIPPPPPPPPPMLPPVTRASIVQTPKIPKQKKNKPPPSAPVIMRDDILNVKLRKVDRFPCMRENKEDKGSVLPLITVSDLSSVTLKPRQANSRSNEAQKENEPPPSIMLKKILRKTTMKRSPGGTPMVTRSANHSLGSGPTPEFTRALQRKFRSLKISPLTVLENSRSPTFES